MTCSVKISLTLLILAVLLMFGIGPVISSAAATPAISAIDSQATGAGTIYINQTSSIAISGTAEPGTSLRVLVDSVPASTTPASPVANGSGNYSFTFDTAASASTKSIVVEDTTNALSSAAQDILVDVTSPVISGVHWQDPADGSYVGPNLNKIWAVVSDTGGAGVNYTTSTITFNPAVTGSTTQDGSDIKFVPTGNNWGLFTNGTTYTITVTLYDQAGNTVTDNSHSFTVDRTKPAISAVHWQDPTDGGYVGPNLNKIWAVVSDTGGAGVDYTTSTITFNPAVTGSTTQDGSDIKFVPTSNNWGLFLNATTYTVAVTVCDLVGNTRTNNTYQFTVDRTPPNASAIHWSAPLDNNWVGQGLNSIWAIVSDASSGIDWTNSTIVVSNGIGGTNSNNASNRINFAPSNGWKPVSDGGDFNNNTNYTITTTIYDKAGNSKVDTANFNFDYDSPVISDITWKNPVDGVYVGPSLNQIRALYTESGGSGINWSKCTFTVGTIPGTFSTSGSPIDFTPTNGWPETDGTNPHDFVHNTFYNITVTLYDNADNSVTLTEHFRFDYQAPALSRIRWQYPNRSSEPDYGISYFMGADLQRIWADFNDSITVTDSTDPVDQGAGKTEIIITPNPAGGSQSYSVDGQGRTNHMQWDVSAGDFTNGTLYTITVNLHDKAGNSASYTREFKKDDTDPGITNVSTSDGTIYNTGYNGGGTYVMMRGSHVPLNPNPFTVAISDGPNDFNFPSTTRYSLNADGLAPNGGTDQKSRIRVYSLEGAGLISNDNDDNYTALSANTYQGTLTIPGFPSTDGLYAVSTTARDWAYYSSNPTHNYGNNLSIFLVDDTSPATTEAFPPQDTASYYVNSGRTYLRTTDMTVYPKLVSVTASDTPEDRLTNLFGRRLDFANSAVTLLNPDGNARTLSGLSWTQPAPVTDLNNNFVATIAQTDNPPIYPVPEWRSNTIEGRYTVHVHLEDRITSNFGTANTSDADYYFFNDVTPPRMVSWNPFSSIPLADSYTSNFSNVQISIYDPDLRDGYPGSGVDLDHCRVDLYMTLTDRDHSNGFWINPGNSPIASAGPFVGPQGQSLNNQPIEVFLVNEIDKNYPIEQRFGRKIFYKVADSTIAGDGSINVTALSAPGTYVVGWKIPSTYAHDSTSVIGALPNQPITKDGYYFSNNYVADMVGNTSQVESINFNYQSPGGALTLTSDKAIIAADGSSTATVRSSPIYLRGSTSTVVQDGTLVTVSASLGQIITPDEDTLMPGVQVSTSGGVATFVVRSIAGQAGPVTLRVKSVSGTADSGDVNGLLEIMLSTLSNLSLQVEPAMEKLAAAYTITATSNKILPLTADVDEMTITFGKGTLLPAVIPGGAIRVNNTDVATATVADNVLTLLLPVTIPINSTISVDIPKSTGLINPPSGVYTLSMATTQDQVAATFSYDIIISIDDQEVIPAPNPSGTGRMRFFFNLQGPGQAELMILNLKGDRISRVRNHYSAAKKGEVIDWDTSAIAPGIYWAVLTIKYDDGHKKVYNKKKVVIIP